MWFNTKRLPKEQIELRLFEFKGAVQTCDLERVKFSLRVLISDLGQKAKESIYFKEIEDFSDSLSEGGSRRKILYYSFENLLNSLKLDKNTKLNEFIQIPHGFSCPLNTDLAITDFSSFWENTSSLKLHLDESEVNARILKFSEFILNEHYNDDELNAVLWHKSALTSDIVSGCLYAGDSPRLKEWEQFSDVITSLIFSKSLEKRNAVIDKFSNMVKKLPYNNFIF
jgi:hypothetical protein